MRPHGVVIVPFGIRFLPQRWGLLPQRWSWSARSEAETAAILGCPAVPRPEPCELDDQPAGHVGATRAWPWRVGRVPGSGHRTAVHRRGGIRPAGGFRAFPLTWRTGAGDLGRQLGCCRRSRVLVLVEAPVEPPAPRARPWHAESLQPVDVADPGAPLAPPQEEAVPAPAALATALPGIKFTRCPALRAQHLRKFLAHAQMLARIQARHPPETAPVISP